MKYLILIWTFSLTTVSFTYGQSTEIDQLRKMTVTTIEDFFAEPDTNFKIHYFLPSVKNLNDSVLFELEQEDLDSKQFRLTTEKDLREKENIQFPVYLQHIQISQSSDTVNIEIEVYQIEFKNYIIFKKPIRYWVCKGSFPQYVDGQFVFDQDSKTWKFLSGRQKLEEWKNEWKARLNKK